jgi:hypothetical protein
MRINFFGIGALFLFENYKFIEGFTIWTNKYRSKACVGADVRTRKYFRSIKEVFHHL